MLRYIIIAVLFGVLLWAVSACQNAAKMPPQADDSLKVYFMGQADSTILWLDSLQAGIARNDVEAAMLSFGKARDAYKTIEAVAEYFFQGITKRINGPALPDIKTDDNQVWPPHGFQVVEEMLFAAEDEGLDKDLCINECRLIQTDLRFLRTQLASMSISEAYFAELVQHQIVRIATLGLTGFDSPVAFRSIQEAEHALRGLAHMVRLYLEDRPKADAFATAADKAIAELRKHPDFDTFDRLVFIRQHLFPLGETVKTFYPLEAKPRGARAFNGSIKDLFTGKGLDADHFTPYQMAHSNPDKVVLGERLFYEPALSQSGKLSCGSCHKPELAFTDGLAKAQNFVHGGSLERNTPTVLYAGFQNNQFYDMRAVYLEDQIEQVIHNRNEFNFSKEKALQNILGKPEYLELARKAFPDKDSIGSYELRNAIAAYVRSLAPFNSRLDQYWRGNDGALSEMEKLGFNIFAGKAKCATCHFMPIFNGTIPPWYNKTESEVIGTPRAFTLKNAQIDPDPGRYVFNALEPLRFAFKTPTVRNVVQTAPYMHNGAFATLEQVVEFYHIGGGAGAGIPLEHQTLPFDSLQLNETEKRAIVKFMQALSDEKPAL